MRARLIHARMRSRGVVFVCSWAFVRARHNARLSTHTRTHARTHTNGHQPTAAASSPLWQPGSLFLDQRMCVRTAVCQCVVVVRLENSLTAMLEETIRISRVWWRIRAVRARAHASPKRVRCSQRSAAANVRTSFEALISVSSLTPLSPERVRAKKTHATHAQYSRVLWSDVFSQSLRLCMCLRF